MRFSGFWTDGQGGAVTLRSGSFDDTELTPESNWTRAYQNGDDDLPSGFVDPIEALRDLCIRIASLEGVADDEGMDLVPEEVVCIPEIQDLARVTVHLLNTATMSRDHAVVGAV